MNTQFKIIPEETVGEITIKENCQFNKIRAEKVIIGENVTARLFGSVNNVILKKGAKLILHGIIFGNIKNQGGEIFVSGK